ncbi:hypothetical protein MKX08_002398 [Trichoderma sp. CBMAI-0020]|nr:hypothetical protein MKX08_002398 [Trichoderma sp. CBMAI-0020]
MFRLYGLSIEELVARNLIISPRTTTECMIDAHVECLLRGVTDIIGPGNESPGFDSAHPAVYDLFCGSGNISYHIDRHLNRPVFASGLDLGVYKATTHNLALLGVPSQNTNAGFSFTLSLADYCNLLVSLSPMNHPSDLYIIEPPWGSAASPDGLDLTKTSPPVQEIMAEIEHQRTGVPCYVALKALRNITKNSLEIAMAKATPIRVIQCSPVYGYGVDFHIYRLE